MPAKQPTDPERQLMIKTKVCQRIRKELDYYIQEVQDNEAQLQEMKEQNKDPYDIKKFEEVVGESRMMVPDSERRLKEAVRDLEQFLKVHQEELNVDGEWKLAAQEVLRQEHTSLQPNAPATKDTAQNNAEETPTSTNVNELKEGEAF